MAAEAIVVAEGPSTGFAEYSVNGIPLGNPFDRGPGAMLAFVVEVPSQLGLE